VRPFTKINYSLDRSKEAGTFGTHEFPKKIRRDDTGTGRLLTRAISQEEMSERQRSKTKKT